MSSVYSNYEMSIKIALKGKLYGNHSKSKYLAVVEDDWTYESPSAASQLTPVHKVLQLTDLHSALKPAHTKRRIHFSLLNQFILKHLVFI